MPSLCLANDFKPVASAAEISIGEGDQTGLLIVLALKDEIEQEWSVFGESISSPQLCVCVYVGGGVDMCEIDKLHDS